MILSHMTQRKKNVVLLAVLATKHPVIVCEVSHDLFIYSIGQSTQNTPNFIQDKQTLRMCCKHLLSERGAFLHCKQNRFLVWCF